MRILFLGDIVGEPGRKIVTEFLPVLRQEFRLDAVIANAENSAGGSGITARCQSQFAQAGVNAITMGDHIYRQKEIYDLFERQPPICRPANYPPEAPGPDHCIFETESGERVGVVSLLGRIFMKPCDCPFRAAERVLERLRERADAIVVDFHAEATSEKQCMARHLAGKVAAVLGTHTHVPTADACILEPGTAFITDVGMTGPYDGVIGRRWERILHNMLTCEPTFFDVARGDPRLSGALLEINSRTGRADSVQLIHLTLEELKAIEMRVEAR